MIINYVAAFEMRRREHTEEFKQIFGVPLEDYWERGLGFDVVKFDEEFVRPPEGTSTRGQVLKAYGPSGVEVMEKLLATIT